MKPSKLNAQSNQQTPFSNSDQFIILKEITDGYAGFSGAGLLFNKHHFTGPFFRAMNLSI
jgi:hypothetical protein